MNVLDKFKRYQQGLKLHHLFPSIEGECACGCKKELSSNRRKWASDQCRRKALFEFYVIKGDNEVIRDILFSKEEGFCRACGVFDPAWEVDHIIEVREGGGACGLENFQTLCPSCHFEKTIETNQSIIQKKQAID